MERPKRPKVLVCYCDTLDEHCIENECRVARGGRCYQSDVQKDNSNYYHPSLSTLIPGYKRHLEHGCFDKHASNNMKSLLQCNNKTTRCCHKYKCNKDSRTFSPLTTLAPKKAGFIDGSTSDRVDGDAYSAENITQLVLLVSITFFLIALIIIIAILYLRRRREIEEKKEMGSSDERGLFPSATSGGDAVGDAGGVCSAAEQMETLFSCARGAGGAGGAMGSMSGSASLCGSATAACQSQTVSRQIQLLQIIGRGRYGEVWKGLWRGQAVSVKIFFATEEASWHRETELYQTVLLRHDNILGFIASDVNGVGYMRQLCLITDYHPNGSLFDYLRRRPLSVLDTMEILHSIAAGISYLHQEIRASNGTCKPAIAHRDIKARNILVKSDSHSMQCCIADLGLAVKYIEATNEIDIAPNTRQGTRRYMAPEILDETIARSQFGAYKHADVYSFGLVMWEVCRRCKTFGMYDEYQMAYQDVLPSDPTFEEMKQIVCYKQYRPELYNRWKTNPILHSVSRLIEETWTAHPNSRPTSLRLRKSLKNLLTAAAQEHQMSTSTTSTQRSGLTAQTGTQTRSMTGSRCSGSISPPSSFKMPISSLNSDVPLLRSPIKNGQLPMQTFA